MSVPNHEARRETRADAAAQVPALLATVDGIVRGAQVRERFGDLGPAFSTVLGSWIEPFAAAMRGMEPTARLRAAARAISEIARLTAAFAGEAARSIGDRRIVIAGAGPGEGYAELAGRIDHAFREFSSSLEFDHARRCAAAAILDWLEHDRATASSVARALQSRPASVPERSGDSMPADTAPDSRAGSASLKSYPGSGEARAAVLVVPGFTTGASMFDLDPQHSTARTLAEHGVGTWLLDWGRPDETDRPGAVANQLDRIDRALDTVRQAPHGRHPALMGHFHGGLLALLYCIRNPGKAGALVTLSTPVEFASSDDAFADWLRACDGERLVDIFGDIPGPLMAALTGAASPMGWCGNEFFTLLGGLDSAAGAVRIARFEQARRFPPAFPGESFRGLYRAFYRDNSFAADRGAVIDGRRYDLSCFTTPLRNVFASDDRIVPPGASVPLAQWVGAAPDSNRECRSGHFDLLASHRAHAELLPDIAAWMVGNTRGS